MKLNKEYFIEFTEGRINFISKSDAVRWCRDFFHVEKIYIKRKDGAIFLFTSNEAALPTAVLHEITVASIEQLEFAF